MPKSLVLNSDTKVTIDERKQTIMNKFPGATEVSGISKTESSPSYALGCGSTCKGGCYGGCEGDCAGSSKARG